jgi:hypothetical protein
MRELYGRLYGGNLTPRQFELLFKVKDEGQGLIHIKDA